MSIIRLSECRIVVTGTRPNGIDRGFVPGTAEPCPEQLGCGPDSFRVGLFAILARPLNNQWLPRARYSRCGVSQSLKHCNVQTLPGLPTSMIWRKLMSADARVKQLNLNLPPAQTPAGTYVPVVRTGNLIYVSGHGPKLADGTYLTGIVGKEITEEQGREAARQTGLCILATVQNYLGTLDRVVRLVKVLGMVNAAPDFERHPSVMNGFSDLLVEVFGDNGKGARSAVGMGSLPSRIAVEVEAIFEIRD